MLYETSNTLCVYTTAFRLSVVESVPQNLSITKLPVPSTYEAWQFLISNAVHSLDVAAYKSSLRGLHVFNYAQDYSAEGELIYEELQQAGLARNVHIRVSVRWPSAAAASLRVELRRPLSLARTCGNVEGCRE